MKKLIFGLDARIVFFGDSLTFRRNVVFSAGLPKRFGDGYTGSYVDVLLKRILVNFPENRLLIWNNGESGNDVPALLERVEPDVLALKPDWVVLFVGQNDAKQYDAAAFDRNLRKLGAVLQKAEIRTVHLSTTPFPGAPEKNALLDGYDPVIRAVAEERGAPYVDLKGRFKRVMDCNAGAKHPVGLFTSGPHLSELGNILVADAVFDAVTIDP
jgi:lysophospholipase L1-like esterase